MKRFYVHYYKNFSNTYRLLYVENAQDKEALPMNAKRITRKEAIELAKREHERRECGDNGGFADEAVYPAEMYRYFNHRIRTFATPGVRAESLIDEYDMGLYPNGRIWERM